MKFNSNKYTLYNKNIPIIDFHCDRDEVDSPVFIEDKRYSEGLPFYFTSLNDWIGNRRAPRNREHINEILNKCGCNDLEGFIRFTYGASLNDTFWIKPADRDLSWDDVSLYKNHFDTTIAKIAFDGGLMGEQLSSPSPELMTDGQVAKCWRRFGDEIYLLKRGGRFVSASGKEQYGYGPYSEQYAYDIAKEICKYPLYYEVIRYHRHDAAKCKLFCSEEISYAPIAYVLGPKAKFKECLEFYDSIGCAEEFKEMLVLDSLIINEDRHLKNFGVLYEADSMKIIGMAPVFDNNLALFPNNKTNEITNIDSMLINRMSHFNTDLTELGKRCITPSIKAKLINLKDFEFSRDKAKSLSEERLVALENIIQRQADYLLDRRVYSVMMENAEVVKVDDLSISFRRSNNPERVSEILIDKNFEISEFDIVTENDDLIHVKDCIFDVYDTDDVIELDLYETNCAGKSKSLKVKRLNNFVITSKDTNEVIKLIADSLTVQLSSNNRVETTIFDDYDICSEQKSVQGKGTGKPKEVPNEISDIADAYDKSQDDVANIIKE